MSRLAIFPDQGVTLGETTLQPHQVCTDPGSIQAELRARGLDFEQWPTRQNLAPGADQSASLSAYAEEIGRIQAAEGYSTVDAIRMHPEHPERVMLRDKFLAEHIHTEDEVRYQWRNHVRPADIAHIEPWKDKADVVVDNTEHWQAGLESLIAKMEEA